MEANGLPSAVKQKVAEARAVGESWFKCRNSLLEKRSYWLRPRLFIHGNMWCALVGESVQSGVAGFGYTPAEAFEDFDRRDIPPLILEIMEHIKAERLANSFPVVHSPAWFVQPEAKLIGQLFWVQYGDNVQNGVAGFGRTLDEAYRNFDANWFTHTGPLVYQGRRTLTDDDATSRNGDSSGGTDRPVYRDADWWMRNDETSQQ